MIQGWLSRPLWLKKVPNIGWILSFAFLAINNIECFVFRDLEEPSRWIFRRSANRPLIEGFHERILNYIFCQVYVFRTENSRQYRYQFSGFMPENVVKELTYIVIFWFQLLNILKDRLNWFSYPVVPASSLTIPLLVNFLWRAIDSKGAIHFWHTCNYTCNTFIFWNCCPRNEAGKKLPNFQHTDYTNSITLGTITYRIPFIDSPIPKWSGWVDYRIEIHFSI